MSHGAVSHPLAASASPLSQRARLRCDVARLLARVDRRSHSCRLRQRSLQALSPGLRKLEALRKRPSFRATCCSAWPFMVSPARRRVLPTQLHKRPSNAPAACVATARRMRPNIGRGPSSSVRQAHHLQTTARPGRDWLLGKERKLIRVT